jgi:hypothetical protein
MQIATPGLQNAQGYSDEKFVLPTAVQDRHRQNRHCKNQNGCIKKEFFIY